MSDFPEIEIISGSVGNKQKTFELAEQSKFFFLNSAQSPSNFNRSIFCMLSESISNLEGK